MKIDDLIGILFLLFFIVGPALRGLLKPREPLVEVELPEELEEVQRRLREAATGEAEPAPRPQPAARPAPQPQPAPAAATRRVVPAAPAQPAPAASQQVAEGHAAGARSRQRIEEARLDAHDMAESERAAFAPVHERREHRAALPVHRKAIVHGMLWHEILSEPVSRRRARKRKRKLIS